MRSFLSPAHKQGAHLVAICLRMSTCLVFVEIEMNISDLRRLKALINHGDLNFYIISINVIISIIAGDPALPVMQLQQM